MKIYISTSLSFILYMKYQIGLNSKHQHILTSWARNKIQHTLFCRAHSYTCHPTVNLLSRSSNTLGAHSTSIAQFRCTRFNSQKLCDINGFQKPLFSMHPMPNAIVFKKAKQLTSIKHTRTHWFSNFGFTVQHSGSTLMVPFLTVAFNSSSQDSNTFSLLLFSFIESAHSLRLHDFSISTFLVSIQIPPL